MSLCTVVVCLLAQSVGRVAPPRSPLDQAVALLGLGNPQAAKELLAQIEARDPSYEAARRYLALCLHELKDQRGFLKAIESIDLDAPVVPPEVREDLAFRQIDALFQCRKFEDIFDKIRAFRTTYSVSHRLEAVREYEMAALFERGMKKAYEAAMLKDADKSAAR
ncbi:MAG: hypothetical protein N2379_05310 [Verrucomicrobiae bacterium]|nr:hypothetical protein [Verrucomicrobiae bacterium]